VWVGRGRGTSRELFGMRVGWAEEEEEEDWDILSSISDGGDSIVEYKGEREYIQYSSGDRQCYGVHLCVCVCVCV
jgi:hypothetical protein